MENGWKETKGGRGKGRPNSGNTRYPPEDSKDWEDEENDDDEERFMEKMLEQGMKKRQEIRKGDHPKSSRED